MASTQSSRFHNEVVDIAHQIAQLADQRDGLLSAQSLGSLELALESLERSVDTLIVCVAGLKYRARLQLNCAKESAEG
jgi:hypothetical protein